MSQMDVRQVVHPQRCSSKMQWPVHRGPPSAGTFRSLRCTMHSWCTRQAWGASGGREGCPCSQVRRKPYDTPGRQAATACS